MNYVVEDIQCVEPDALEAPPAGVCVVVDWNPDSMGFPRADVYGETKADLFRYARSQWGGDDATGGWYTEYVVGGVQVINEARRATLRDATIRHLGPIDTSSESFMRLVEDSWYYETKGEINVSAEEGEEPGELHDNPLRRLISQMASNAQTYIDATACEQFDYRGNTLEDVTPGELAHRVARALSILWFGYAS